MAQKVIIDTDPGVDDAMAILFACLHPEIDLVGLTSVFGNVTVDTGTRNALFLSERAGLTVPVARGAEKPLVQAPRPIAHDIHGPEGLGDLPAQTPQGKADPRSAPEFICDMVHAHPGEIVLCPVGPLTNLALALERDPAIAAKTRSVVVMGASIRAGGNATPHAEANIWQDPHAARQVLAADWDVSLVGLDVTHEVICGHDDFAMLAGQAPDLGGLLNEIVQFYFRFHETNDGFFGCYMHDPTAVISIIRPGLFESETMPVEVVTDGEEAGRTKAVTGDGVPRAKVLTAVDSEGVRRLFLDTIAASF